MVTVGAVLLPQLPPERFRSVARAADEAGLAELWVWEDCFLESGVATAAAMLAWTERVKVCVGVLPVPLRNVALAGMEIATLDRLFPGRLAVGVGHGVQHWMGQVGARPASPVTLLREYLDALRALLRGETVTTAGKYVNLDRVALDWPPSSAPPILAGVTGPRSLRLSGESADGTILSGGTRPDGVRAARSLVEGGRAAAGRTDPHPITVYLHAATGPTAAGRMATECRKWGYDSTVDVSVIGTAEQIATGIRRWAEAGADTVVLQPTPDDPDPEGFMRLVGAEVAPLLS